MRTLNLARVLLGLFREMRAHPNRAHYRQGIVDGKPDIVAIAACGAQALKLRAVAEGLGIRFNENGSPICNG